MINRPRRNDSHAEWLIEKQMRAAEAHKTHWLIKAQASLERSLQNIRSPDEWEEDFLKDNAGSSPLRGTTRVHARLRLVMEQLAELKEQ